MVTIRKFDVYGQQQETKFDIHCASSVTYNSIGERIIHYTVIGTPLLSLLRAQPRTPRCGDRFFQCIA
jgi:hypothetical protein